VIPVPVPGAESSLHVTREELEHAVRPMLQSAAVLTLEVIRSSGILLKDLSGVLLVGGSSRVPLMGRLLHTELGIPPTVLEQPELPVAEGAIIDPFQPPDEIAGEPSFALPPYVPEPLTPTSGAPFASVPVSGAPAAAYPVSASFAPAPVSAPPVSAPPVSAPPVSAPPVSAPPVSARATAAVPPPAPPQPSAPQPSAPPFAVQPPPAPAPTAPLPAMRPVPLEEAPARSGGRWSRRLVIMTSAAAVLALLIGTGTAWALISNRHRTSAGGPGSGSSTGAGHTAGLNAASSAPARSGPWSRKANLPVQLEGAAVAAYQDKVWVAGGLRNDGPRTKLTSTYVYDPGANTWTKGPDLPRPISHAALVGTSHGLYFMGGWIDAGGSKQVLRLDEKANRWVDDTPLPDTRVGGAAAWDGTRIVYAGGTRADQTPGDEVWAFQGSRWTQIGKLKQGRQKLAAASDGAGKVWVLSGGDQKTGKKYGLVETVTGDRIVEEESLAAPAVDGGIALRINGATCELGGREVGHGALSGWWCDRDGFDDSLPKLDPPRAGLGIALIDRTVYVVGGYGDGFDGTDRVEAFPLAPA